MDVWKYEIISRVDQDISLVRFAQSWDILCLTPFTDTEWKCQIIYPDILILHRGLTTCIYSEGLSVCAAKDP